MKYSKLKNDLEIMKLQHKHELDLLKMKQEMTEKQLINKCTHKYDDGSSASVGKGTQWDWYSVCEICGSHL